MDSTMTAQQRIAALTEQLAEARAELAAMQDPAEMSKRFSLDYAGPSEGGFNVQISADRSWLVAAMAQHLMDCLDTAGAVNYIEMGIQPAGQPEAAFILTIQRATGKSPHTLRQEAEATVAEAREIIEQCKPHIESLGSDLTKLAAVTSGFEAHKADVEALLARIEAWEVKHD